MTDALVILEMSNGAELYHGFPNSLDARAWLITEKKLTDKQADAVLGRKPLTSKGTLMSRQTFT